MSTIVSFDVPNPRRQPSLSERIGDVIESLRHARPRLDTSVAARHSVTVCANQLHDVRVAVAALEERVLQLETSATGFVEVLLGDATGGETK